MIFCSIISLFDVALLNREKAVEIYHKNDKILLLNSDL